MMTSFVVQFVSGETLSFDVASVSTVWQLKKWVKRSVDVPKRQQRLGTLMVFLIIFLRCHTVETDETSNDKVLPETSFTTNEVITAEMAAGCLRVSRLVHFDSFG